MIHVFFHAFSLFLSYQEYERARRLSDHGRKMEFKEFLCHPKYGIPVYILSNKFTALRSYDVDYKELFKELLNWREKVSDDSDLTKEPMDQVLNSIDAAWDKKVVKYVLVSTRSRTEIEKIGTKGIWKGISECKKYFSTAVDKEFKTKKKRKRKKLINWNLSWVKYHVNGQKHRKTIFWKILIHVIRSCKIQKLIYGTLNLKP